MGSKKKRSSKNMRKNANPVDESSPKTADSGTSLGELSARRMYRSPTWDRQAYTGSNYIPAAADTMTTPRRPYAQAPPWEPQGPTPSSPSISTAPGRTYFTPVRSEDIRVLERQWKGGGSQRLAAQEPVNWSSSEACR